MAKFDPTPSQKAAIEARDRMVLVSAGAGSGKTRVLTERLMAYIRQGADLDSFLIITYTNAAAGELRGRIMGELARAQAAEPGNRRLRRQSALCRRARIGTIHSFCASLLRENCQELGLDPDFAVMADERAAAMRAAALDRVLEERYARGGDDPGFLLLADTVGAGRDDAALAELTLRLHEKMQCHARPEDWARRVVAELRPATDDVGRTIWGREIMTQAAASVDFWRRELDRLLGEIAGDSQLRRKYDATLRATAADLDALRQALDRGWDEARSCLNVAFPRPGAVKGLEDGALDEHVKVRRLACKKAVERIGEKFGAPAGKAGREAAELPGVSSEKLARQLAATAPAMEALLSLVLDFDRAYAGDKRRAGLVDYADLEHMAARLLLDEDGRPTELAGRVSRRYTEIMVDEYQDVSQVQEAIFQAISREGRNLFLVGDVKQSVYRFRLADPTIFTNKYQICSLSPGPGEPQKILLRENFRSRQEILDWANHVFSLCMSRQLGDVDYGEEARLLRGLPGDGPPAPKPELLLLSVPKAEGEEPPAEKAAREAALVAGRIRELLASGARVSDQNGSRPLDYGDIAILLHNANRVGPVYRRELIKRGIPVSSGQSDGFFAAGEVSAAVALLTVVDDPHQDLPLLTALSFNALGFEAGDLAAIRAEQPEGELYAALRLRAETDEKARRFVRTLDALREEAPDLSATELVWRVIEDFDLRPVCAAMADGERRQARLTALAGLAGQFDNGGNRGLHRFVLWLGQLAAKGAEPSLGDSGGGAVQLMSVHRSKGLEFPVVFLCDTARSFNLSDSTETVLVHPELGLGPKVTDLERGLSYPSLARSAIGLRLKREALSEELRLLYVALTRPKERLIMTAAMTDPSKKLEKVRSELSDPMDPEILAQAGCWADWLLTAALADREGRVTLRLLPPEAADSADAPAGELSPACDAPDEAALAELERALAFRYPWPLATELPSKVTATGLKDRAGEDPEAHSLEPRPPRPPRPFRVPDFGRAERPVSGAERGTATHLLLQHIDLAKTGDPASVREEVERLRARRTLSDREAQAVDVQAVVKLFRSPLGRRMLAAGDLRREFRFSLLLEAGELFPAEAGEELLLQGVVDCFWEEAGALTVVDYKTDQISGEAAARDRARRYAPQLRAYARALERICQKPVKECILYFLGPGLPVSLPPEADESVPRPSGEPN